MLIDCYFDFIGWVDGCKLDELVYCLWACELCDGICIYEFEKEWVFL